MTDVAVRRALISCWDKTGLEGFAGALHELGVTLISTGSTAAALRAAGLPVTEVAEVTGFPECLDGRVKTLHPAIHAAILADRSRPSHLEQLEELGIAPIDLVVVNLYPFADTVARGAGAAEAIEMIDIGGPTLLRAAAKNHAHVAVVVDPADYGPVIEELRQRGAISADTRRRLAATAFSHTASYDAAVASWFHRDQRWPPVLHLAVPRTAALRYGENPHQEAALYGAGGGVAGATQLHGKELSYNNLLDTDAAWALVGDFTEPCVAIIKHTNPAGVAVADDLATAYRRALEGDPVSAFGGIVAANRPIDEATARLITEVFTEVVIAPDFSPAALEVLRSKRNLRILRAGPPPSAGDQLRSISGGVLVQQADTGPEPFDEWKVVSRATPDEPTLADLRFAWLVAKHVRSNAIVLARDRQVVGVGAGQMSRVDAVELAVRKAGERAAGSVLASDAFFPFRDGPDVAARAGVRAIVQPGGSVRDEEVIAAADEHGLVMVFTGRRHFRH